MESVCLHLHSEVKVERVRFSKMLTASLQQHGIITQEQKQDQLQTTMKAWVFL
jgi:hypothetical protein